MMALPPNERHDRAKVDEAVREGKFPVSASLRTWAVLAPPATLPATGGAADIRMREVFTDQDLPDVPPADR